MVSNALRKEILGKKTPPRKANLSANVCQTSIHIFVFFFGFPPPPTVARVIWRAAKRIKAAEVSHRL